MTEGASNEGHYLYTRVEWWFYIYIVITAFITIILCGFGGIVAMDVITSENNKETEAERAVRLHAILTGEGIKATNISQV